MSLKGEGIAKASYHYLGLTGFPQLKLKKQKTKTNKQRNKQKNICAYLLLLGETGLERLYSFEARCGSGDGMGKAEEPQRWSFWT